jgi:transcription elongation factor SPT6
MFKTFSESMRKRELEQEVAGLDDKNDIILDARTLEGFERKYIEGAKSIRDLKDVEAFMTFYKEFNKDEDSNELGYIRPNKRSFLDDIKDAKLNKYGEQFFLSPFDLAFNLELNSQPSEANRSRLIPPKDPMQEPPKLATKYLNNTFDQEIKVMTNVCRFLAMEMYAHPMVKTVARTFLRSTCIISTEPTEEGKKEIDVFHPSFRVKRIKAKPADQFTNDVFLDIIENERKGYIKLTIDCNEELTEISNKIGSALIINQPTDKNTPAMKWKIMREEAVRILTVDYILPEFKKEIKAELIEKAEKYVIAESSRNFYELLMTGPYKKHKNYDDNLFEDDYPTVMSMVYDSEKSEIHCVVVDTNGEVAESTVFTQMCQKLSRITKLEDKKNYEQDFDNCKAMLKKYNVDVIVVGTGDLKCKFLREQMKNIDLVESTFDNRRNSSINNDGIWVTYGDITIPRIYANSPLADKELPDYDNVHLRTAISLARFKQNPISEMLALWHEEIHRNYCLSIPLHSMMRIVNQNKLAESLEYEAIRAVNSIGIDINKALEYKHHQALLQFISGLGPRKANSLMDHIRSYNGLLMRAQMYANNMMGKKVFSNCSGFIKVKVNTDGDKKNLLDMTRIHPDVYPYANKVALRAVEDDLHKGDDPIELILKNPIKLKELDLKDYIRKTEEKVSNAQVTAAIIEFIEKEFTHPFLDPRPEHKDLEGNKLFDLLLCDPSFGQGHIVLAQVIGYDRDKHVKCRLQNGLEATLWIKDVFEDLDSIDNEAKYKEMQEKYKENYWFEARVKSIDYGKFKVDLITKPSELASHKNYYMVNKLDKFFLIEDEDLINRNYQPEVKTEHRKYIPRSINHPQFRNVTFQLAIEHLRNREIGSFIFRPSSQGINNITLTWKFCNHVYSHIDILEEDKIPGSSIGSKLRIGNETYSSLQEIAERYVKPCERLIKDAMNNRKFFTCESVEDFEKKLKEDKTRDPNLTHYSYTILREFPQFIVMGYANKMNQVTKEFIKVKPAGLFFHDEYFPSIDELSVWFKKNYSTDKYRDYTKKIKPPTIEDRRRETNIEFQDYKMDIDDNKSINSSSYKTSNFKKDKSCHNCKELGHFANECPSKKDFVGNKRRRSPDAERAGYDNNRKPQGSWGGKSNFSDKQDSGWGSTEIRNDNTSYMNKNSSLGNNDRQGGSANKNEGSSGWGNSSSTNNVNAFSSGNSGWGTSSTNNAEPASTSWGNTNTGKTDTVNAWGSSNKVDLFANKPVDNNSSWGTSDKPVENTTSSGWGGSANQTTSNQPQAETSSGWGNTGGSSSNTGGWGSSNNISDNKPSSNSWGNSNSESKGESSGWGGSSSNNNTNWVGNANTDNNSNSWGGSSNSNTRGGGNDFGNSSMDRGRRPREEGSWGGERKPRDNSSRPKGCFNCGEEGHMSNACPNPKKERSGPRACFNCGEEGHMSNACPNPKKERSGPKACFNCGEEGHMSNSCPNPKKERKFDGPKKCFNCNEEGHMSNACPNPKKERSDSSKPRACFNCGEEGHMSNSCPNPKKERKFDGPKKCFNCNEEGHMSNACPNPRQPRRDGGGGRGGRGGRDGNRGDRSSDGFRSPSNYNNEGGWSSSNNNNSGGNAGWSSSTTEGNTGGGWGNSGSDNNTGSSGGWGSSGTNNINTTTTTTTSGGWGSSTTTAGNDNTTSGWGSSSAGANNNISSGGGWGNNASSNSSGNNNSSGGWGSGGGGTNTTTTSTTTDNSAGGWGSSNTTATTTTNNTGGWGTSTANNNTANTDTTQGKGTSNNTSGWGSSNNTGGGWN